MGKGNDSPAQIIIIKLAIEDERHSQQAYRVLPKLLIYLGYRNLKPSIHSSLDRLAWDESSQPP